MNRLNILPPSPEEHTVGRFPSFLHRDLPKGKGLQLTKKSMSSRSLFTVCEEAKCPNLPDCWSRKIATFLVMGKSCTRACGFCDIAHSKSPPALDPQEKEKVLEAVLELDLHYVVITHVARDDLSDGGATHIAEMVEYLHKQKPSLTIEILVSDFEGNLDALKRVIQAKPDVFNHNLETVRRLTPRVRHKATYDRSLEVLHFIKKESSLKIKSGLMVGLGETNKEIEETLDDLKKIDIDIVTIGQYLQASMRKLLVKRFVTPEEFTQFKQYGESIGIPYVFSAPFVRSSFNASEAFDHIHTPK